jgi:hypothetical protein
VKKPNVAWPGVDVMYTAVVVCVLDRESHPTACFPFGPDLAPSSPPYMGKKSRSDRRSGGQRMIVTTLPPPTLCKDPRFTLIFASIHLSRTGLYVAVMVKGCGPDRGVSGPLQQLD